MFFYKLFAFVWMVQDTAYVFCPNIVFGCRQSGD